MEMHLKVCGLRSVASALLNPSHCLYVLTDSLSGQQQHHTHTHVGRVRHSSSGSSGSDPSSEWGKRSQPSDHVSPSPGPHNRCRTPTQQRTLNCSTEVCCSIFFCHAICYFSLSSFLFPSSWKRDGGGWREECGGAAAESLESGCHVNMWRPRWLTR